MSVLALAALLMTTPSEVASVWRCRNQLEVWCTADGCAAAPPEEFTAMDVRADARSGAEICAYTGCWRTTARAVHADGRLLWTGEDVAFSPSRGKRMAADITLLIVEKDGVGFARAGGLATPLLCVRAGPGDDSVARPGGAP
jgi:hypothetical protein